MDILGIKGKHYLSNIDQSIQFVIPSDGMDRNHGRMVLTSCFLAGQSRSAESGELGWLRWYISEARANTSSNAQECSHWCPGQAAQTWHWVAKGIPGHRRVSQMDTQAPLDPRELISTG